MILPLKYLVICFIKNVADQELCSFLVSKFFQNTCERVHLLNAYYVLYTEYMHIILESQL